MSKWAEAKLGDLVERVTEKNAALRVKRVMTVSASHGLIEQEKFFSKSVASKDLSTYQIMRPGDLVYNKSTSKDAPFGVVARLRGAEEAVVTPLYIVFRANSELVDPEFLRLACNGTQFFASLSGRLREGARSHGLLNVRLAEFFSAVVVLPTVPEQRRITAVMSCVDEQVDAVKREVEALGALLKEGREAIFQRMDSFSTVAVGEAIQEAKRPVKVDADVDYKQIGVRSHGRGIFSKEPVKGQLLGAKKVFWVMPGDLVINIVFGWEGAVAVIPESVLGHCGSHRFPTYRRLDDGPIDYVRQFLVSKRGIELLGLASPGGAGRNRTLNRSQLSGYQMPWPDVETQRTIAEALGCAEAQIELLTAELEALRRFRSDLLSAFLSQQITADEAVDQFIEPAA